jgi:hypothetical protein
VFRGGFGGERRENIVWFIGGICGFLTLAVKLLRRQTSLLLLRAKWLTLVLRLLPRWHPELLLLLLRRRRSLLLRREKTLLIR